VYAAKALFLGFLAWWQARFVYGLQATLSERLFAGYLRQPYTFHLQRNSAQLIRNTTNLCGNVAGTFHQSLTLTAELLVMLGICAMLLAVEPIGAVLVMSTLALAGWSFNRFTRTHVLRWGEAVQLHEGLRIQHLQEGLGGAKDVKLLGRESDFLAQFGHHNVGSARAGRSQSTLQQLPRLGLELLAVSGLAALVLATLWAVRPFWYPPQGLHPTGWTYSQLIRERYPRHLIDPAWLSNDMHWIFAESGARIGVLAFGAACIFAVRRLTRHAHTTA